jgi:hypothetical protein
LSPAILQQHIDFSPPRDSTMLKARKYITKANFDKKPKLSDFEIVEEEIGEELEENGEYRLSRAALFKLCHFCELFGELFL